MKDVKRCAAVLVFSVPAMVTFPVIALHGRDLRVRYAMRLHRECGEAPFIGPTDLHALGFSCSADGGLHGWPMTTHRAQLPAEPHWPAGGCRTLLTGYVGMGRTRFKGSSG